MSRSLAQRYERMLRWYPAAHRATYGAEMLGVLLDCAGPDQLRPTLRERRDLLRGALRCRITGLGRSYGGAEWRDAFGILGLVLTTSIFLSRLDDVGSALVYAYRYPGILELPRPSEYLPLPFCAMALLALLAGPQWSRIATGWAAALGQLGIAGLFVHRFDHVQAVSVVPLMVGVVAALCLTVGHGGRRLWWALGSRRALLLATLLGMAALGRLLRFVPYVVGPDDRHLVYLLWSNSAVLWPLTALVLLVGRASPVRKRLWVLAAGLAVLLANSTLSVWTSLGVDLGSLPLPRFLAVVTLVPAAAAALVVVGAEAVRASERRQSSGTDTASPG